MLIMILSETQFDPTVYDNHLWSGWAYKTWQTWHGNFQRTNRQALRGNIMATNRTTIRLGVLYGYFILVDRRLDAYYYREYRRDIYVHRGRNGMSIGFWNSIWTFHGDIPVLENRNSNVMYSLNNLPMAIDINNDGAYDYISLLFDNLWTTEIYGYIKGVSLDPPVIACTTSSTEPVVDKRTRRLFFTDGNLRKIVALKLYIDTTGDLRFDTSMLKYDTVWMRPYIQFQPGFLSMADFNGDGYYEIVVPFLADSTVIYDIDGNRLYKIPKGVYELNGVLVDDINSDGEYEVVVPYDGVYAYKYDGTYLWEFHPTFPLITNAISSADIDYDGDVELVVIADSLYVLNGRDGSKEWSAFIGGYPLKGQGAKLADIDPKSYGMEIIIPKWYGDKGLDVYSADGRLLWREFSGKGVQGLALADVNLDKCLELLVLYDIDSVALIRGGARGESCGYILAIDEAKEAESTFSSERYKIYDITGRLVGEGKGRPKNLKRGVYFYVGKGKIRRVIVW